MSRRPTMSNPSSVKARDELNGMVISAELTLISIIQGVALYFLVNTSYEPIVNLQFQYWLYTLSGLLIIFIVWSRTLIHIFTMIHWPLEFGHNFLYIMITLIEAVLFTQLASPQKWFILGTGFWILAWGTFLFDMRLIRRLEQEARTAKLRELMTATEKEQWLNIKLILPVTVVFYVVASMMVWSGKGHLVFAVLQALGLMGYLLYSLRFYNQITKPILEARSSD